MKTKTLVSIDLDFFNDQKQPLSKLQKLLKHIPRRTPAVVTVEHHEFIPQLQKWIKSGRVKTPFNIINIDKHHDYYYNVAPYHPEGTEINCGNWGFRLPIEWYNRYTWVYGNYYNDWSDWPEAEKWLADRGIQYSTRKKHRLDSLKTKFVAVVACISPDYLCKNMQDNVIQAINIVANYFKLSKAPKFTNNTDIINVEGWRITPRPFLKTLHDTE